MLQLLFDYYFSLFQFLDFPDSGGAIGDGYVLIQNAVYENGGIRYDMVFGASLPEYLAFICSIVSLIIILVLCCLFIYRLIRVVGRLFMGA